MNVTRLFAAGLVVLLVGTAGAAAPGNAPEQAGGDAGPPADLPDPVPVFVADIHDAISGFVDGSVDHLGSAVSDLTPGDDGVDRGSAGDESA